MSGRPVQLLTAVAIAAAASLISIPTASAGCYSSCGVTYAAPVVYSYSYAVPVSYASSCSPCGYGGGLFGFGGGYGSGYSSPMYVVNQGPTYTAPIVGYPETNGGYDGSYPWYGGGAGYGYGGGYRYGGYGLGYRGWGYRGGYRGFGYRGGYRAGWGYRGGLGYRGGWGHRAGWGHRGGWGGGRVSHHGARGGMHRGWRR